MGEAVDIANAFRGGSYDIELLRFLLGYYLPEHGCQTDTYVDYNVRYPLHGFVNYEEYINILQYCLNKIKNDEPIDITYEQCVERCFGNLKVGIKELLKIGQWDKDITNESKA